MILGPAALIKLGKSESSFGKVLKRASSHLVGDNPLGKCLRRSDG